MILPDLRTKEVGGNIESASDLSKLDFSVGEFGQHMKPSLTLEGRLSNEGHGFTRAINGLRA
jgi:hypothetical protein